MNDINHIVAEIDARVAACDPKVVSDQTVVLLACFVRDNWPAIRAALIPQQLACEECGKPAGSDGDKCFCCFVYNQDQKAASANR